MTTTSTPAIDEDRLNGLIGQVVNDFGATISSALVTMGDRLGLYQTLRNVGPVTAEGFASKTGLSGRYLRHWLLNQAASGYISYEPSTGAYSLSPEQALVFADDDSPAAMVGGFTLMTAVVRDEPRITEAMRRGQGLLWREHDAGLFTGTARFFKPGYVANIERHWLPALEDIEPVLRTGGTVADIGCGYGASTILMAQAYPASRFFGFDTHAESIESARQAAADAGVDDRVTFEVAGGRDFPGSGYDLVTYFDCLHDMGDPGGAAKHALAALAPGGSVMLVEPMAGATVEENLNPVGRLFAAASVLVCTPHAIAEGGEPLGTVATDAELRAVFESAGFRSFERVAESATNRVFQARR
ncbi:MAG: methyltransferase domain-containing protein [Dehalococcoidia bacterium]